jgi:hypothetical protein
MESPTFARIPQPITPCRLSCQTPFNSVGDNRDGVDENALAREAAATRLKAIVALLTRLLSFFNALNVLFL